MKQLVTTVLLLIASQQLWAQSVHVLPGDNSKYLYDRWQILYGNDKYSSSIGNTTRKAMLEKALEVSALEKGHDVQYVLEDNSEFYDENNVASVKNNDNDLGNGQDGFTPIASSIKTESDLSVKQNTPFWGSLYKTDPYLFEVNNPNFKFRLRPLLNLEVGKEKGNDFNIFQNTRGLEIRGIIDEKLYFFSNIFENQARFPNYLMDRTEFYQSLPGNGLYKTYNDKLGIQLNGYDYLNAQAYLGYNLTKSVGLELGHGRHFIGDGVRSLLLSDYSHNYFYLKLNAQFWKFNYQSIFAELAPVSSNQNPGDFLLPKKYMATHYFTFLPNKNLEFGLFETVMFARENHFEFQYLNPVILYRTAEHFIDSPDNVLIGLTARYNAFNTVQFYGQLILDEFLASELRNSRNWWGNKYGYQFGVKYVNALGVKNLDVQYEFNKVRPYTYTHRDTLSSFPNQSVANYSHYNQPLAHPLGANFSEHLVEVNYRPINNVWAKVRAFYSKQGLEKNDGAAYGSNILLPSGLRPEDFGINMYYGTISTTLGIDTKLSYTLVHGLNLNANYIYRRTKTESETYNMNYFGGGISYNINSGIRNY